MKILRFIGWAFMIIALLLALKDIIQLYETKNKNILSLGQIWFDIDQQLGSATLNNSQAFIQRSISASLWENFIQQILISPAFFSLFLMGLGLVWLCRKRGK
tara:strand:- start:423 stop:728 length:306 start_codon:yes stop_codon:yes gene_type:complete